ncbi:MAG: DUF3871 family protein [Bacteroidales bacterium]|nr:DUF3871 family protein [Bacteroidales bacterium]
MELVNVNQDVEVMETSSDSFIVANTQPVAYNELKHKCIIPVFAKDNETTVSHVDFIDAVGEVCHDFFAGEQVLSPAIRVSHPIKGRTPEAMGKPANSLLEHEKTLYYERMAFLYEIPGISSEVGGNKLSLCVGGVRAYNNENLYGRKSEERFKVFIGFKNHVCINLCVHTDGYASELKVMSIPELFNRIFQLVTGFNGAHQLEMLRTFSDHSLTEHQFAQLIGRARLYNYLPQKQRKNIEKLPLSDTQISIVARDYYQDKSFCRSEDGNIDMWKVYNLFTSATKSSYIDTFLDRTAGSFLFIAELINHMRRSSRSWYLS